jgi:glycosyltransferase involved in cell wall biosynthesis
MSTPHILLINVFFAPFSYGGATVVAEQVAKALVQQHGCRVTAISAISRTDLVAYCVTRSEKDGIQNFLINLPPHRQYSEIYNNPRVTEIIAGLLEQLAPDLLHAHCIQDLGAGFLEVAAQLGIPTVLSLHDFWWVCDRQFMIKPDQSYCHQNPIDFEVCKGCVDNVSAARLRRSYVQAQALHADLVTYPSRFAKDLCEASGFAVGKGVVWENGVNLPAADFFDRQAQRRADDPRISFGFLGGPSQMKGWPTIRRAFSDIRQQDFKGYLVDGSLDGTWWKNIEISALKGDWEVFPRFDQENLDDFYSRIDVLLFLSQWKETFGLAIREAVSRGILVIQTDSGGTVEHAQARHENLIAIGASPNVLRQRLEHLLDEGLPQTPAMAVTDSAEQSRRFLSLIAPLLKGKSL